MKSWATLLKINSQSSDIFFSFHSTIPSPQYMPKLRAPLIQNEWNLLSTLNSNSIFFLPQNFHTREFASTLYSLYHYQTSKVLFFPSIHSHSLRQYSVLVLYVRENLIFSMTKSRRWELSECWIIRGESCNYIHSLIIFKEIWWKSS